MRALLTGASGFVGRYLIEHLRSLGDEVIATDRLPAAATSGETRLELDITDKDGCARVIAEHRPNVIYHLAAMAFVPDCEKDFPRALTINVAGASNIYSACAALDAPVTIVLVSSAEVYGRISRRDLPLTEATPIRPGNNYGLSKAMAELVQRRYVHTQVRTVTARPFNHIGPAQRPEFVVSSFAYQLAQIAKGYAPPVLRVGNLDAKRDFSDVRDIVRAYRMAAERGEGLYNLCSGRPLQVRFLLDELIRISGLSVSVEMDPTRMRPSETPVNYGSFEKAQQELGWKPEISIEQSLSEIYEWWQANLESERRHQGL